MRRSLVSLLISGILKRILSTREPLNPPPYIPPQQEISPPSATDPLAHRFGSLNKRETRPTTPASPTKATINDTSIFNAVSPFLQTKVFKYLVIMFAVVLIDILPRRRDNHPYWKCRSILFQWTSSECTAGRFFNVYGKVSENRELRNKIISIRKLSLDEQSTQLFALADQNPSREVLAEFLRLSDDYLKDNRTIRVEPIFKRALSLAEGLEKPPGPILSEVLSKYADYLRSENRIKEADSIQSRIDHLKPGSN